MFIAVDGDDIGRSLELYILDNKIAELECFAVSLTRQFEGFSNKLRNHFNAKIHMIGGDSILASCNSNLVDIEQLEKFRIEFSQQGLSTISIGIGDTSREAYLALKLAKLRGKNRIITFEEINDDKTRNNSNLVKS